MHVPFGLPQQVPLLCHARVHTCETNRKSSRRSLLTRRGSRISSMAKDIVSVLWVVSARLSAPYAHCFEVEGTEQTELLQTLSTNQLFHPWAPEAAFLGRPTVLVHGPEFLPQFAFVLTLQAPAIPSAVHPT